MRHTQKAKAPKQNRPNVVRAVGTSVQVHVQRMANNGVLRHLKNHDYEVLQPHRFEELRRAHGIPREQLAYVTN